MDPATDAQDDSKMVKNMESFVLREQAPGGISDEELALAIEKSIGDIGDSMRILLIVPDITRLYSKAGFIANRYYHLLKETCEVNLLVALGTHVPMTEAECAGMYGDIPFERFFMHNWRTDTVKLGLVPEEFVFDVSEGLVSLPVDVEVSRHLLDGYDLILSVGQVVPHEVIGMANHSKNILVGCGGASMINSSHMLGAYFGMERIMGLDHTPVRKVFDYACETYLKDLPIYYLLTVTTAHSDDIRLHGVYAGRERKYFEMAVAQAAECNISILNQPLKKVVVYLDEQEYRSTWLGNKAVYRTRMAIADGGELIILAPGIERFGEDPQVDVLIRKFGYSGREKIIEISRKDEMLQNNLSAAAHLIHGSTDGRFSVTYCTKLLSKEEVEDVGYRYLPYETAAACYDPDHLSVGMNETEDGEAFFYIPNPALGLWCCRK